MSLHLHPGDDVEALLADLDEATGTDVQKLTLYNLEVSLTLAQQVNEFVRSQLNSIRRCLTKPCSEKIFTLELLGCTGCVDRIAEEFASGTYVPSDEATLPIVRDLIMQHSNLNHFDTSVFVALGMALDSRTLSAQAVQRDELRLHLYQPILSDGKLWTLAQGIQESQHLRLLDFSGCTFIPMHINRATEFLALGLRKNRHLKRLNLSACDLADDQIVCIIEGLESCSASLELLTLRQNKCRSRGMMALASILSTTASSSETLSPMHLDLSCQQIKTNGNTNDDAVMFNPSVVLAWQNSPPFLERLSSLNLSRNDLSDADLQTLLSLLFRPQQKEVPYTCTSFIQDLDLSGNIFSLAGLSHLRQIIQTYQPHHRQRIWKKLTIGASIREGRDSFLPELAEAVQENVFLEDLVIDRSIHSVPLRSSVASPEERINFYTMLNRGGRRVLQQHGVEPLLPLALWPILLERVNHHVDWTKYQQDVDNAKINVTNHLIRQGLPHWIALDKT